MPKEDKGDELSAEQLEAAEAAAAAEALKAERGDDPNPKDKKNEAELTAEEKAEAEAAKKGDDKKDDKEVMLPKRRYDVKSRQYEEERKKREELEAKLARYEKGAKEDGGDSVPDTPEALDKALRALDKEVERARADGDADKVVDLMSQQRQLERDYTNRVLTQTREDATIGAHQLSQLERAIDRIEATYDQLNPDTEAYDDDLATEVNELRDALELKGYEPHAALDRAVDLLVKNAPNMDTAKPAGKKTDVNKNLKTAKQTPPDIDGVGDDSDKGGIKDILEASKLSEKEFDDLPEETKRRLRGDNI